MNPLNKIFQKFGKKGGTVFLASMVLLGAGSAAVITTYFSSSGTASVDNAAITGTAPQGVTYSGDAAPATFYNEISVTNQNDNRPVQYTMVKDSSDNLDSESNVLRGLYEVQNFEATTDEAGEETSIGITVTPNVDEVKYTLDLPAEYNGGDVDLEVSEKSGDNYHVKFRHETGNFDNLEFGIKNPSDGSLVTYDSGSKLASGEAPVRSATATDSNDDGEADQITFRLARELDYQQTFGVNAYAKSSGTTPDSNTNWETEGFSYNDATTHQQVSFTDYLATTESVSASSTERFNAGVFLDSDTPTNGEYQLAINVNAVTER